MQDEDLVTGPFVGGTNGLAISFATDEPPARVFDKEPGEEGEDFDITIKLKNEGEFDILENKVIVTLSGIDVRDFDLSNANMILDRILEGKSEFRGQVVQGDEDEITFSSARYKHDLDADWETNVRADVCYEYQTKATTKVCLKRKATDRDEEDVCQISNQNVGIDNSGAPVQVEEVSTRTSGSNEVLISFVVKNKGSGLIHPPGTFTNKCVKNEDREDRLKLEVFSGSGRYFPQCVQLGNKNVGELKLTNNQKVVKCRIDTKNAPESPIEEPINIKVSYFYRNAISTPLIVEDSEEN